MTAFRNATGRRAGNGKRSVCGIMVLRMEGCIKPQCDGSIHGDCGVVIESRYNMVVHLV